MQDKPCSSVSFRDKVVDGVFLRKGSGIEFKKQDWNGDIVEVVPNRIRFENRRFFVEKISSTVAPNFRSEKRFACRYFSERKLGAAVNQTTEARGKNLSDCL